MIQPTRDLNHRLVDYSSIQSLPEIWSIAAKEFDNIVALKDPHAKPEVALTYTQLDREIKLFAAGLQALLGEGVSAISSARIPPRIALIADNSPRWLIADQGIMTAGAANVVRSSQAEKEELLYILSHSGSIALVVQDVKTWKKLRDGIKELPIQFVVLISDEAPPPGETLKILNYSQLKEIGSNHSLKPIYPQKETLATLM